MANDRPAQNNVNRVADEVLVDLASEKNSGTARSAERQFCLRFVRLLE